MVMIMLKSFQNKKGLKIFQVHTFWCFFLQLAAEKKTPKSVHLKIFQALLTLKRLQDSASQNVNNHSGIKKGGPFLPYWLQDNIPVILFVDIVNVLCHDHRRTPYKAMHSVKFSFQFKMQVKLSFDTNYLLCKLRYVING